MTKRIESCPTIDRSRVLKVYTGKRGCMCGCEGEYRYPKAMQAEGTKRRGYSVDDDEIDDGEVTRVVNEVSASAIVEVADTVFNETVYLVDSNTGRRMAVYVKNA